MNKHKYDLRKIVFAVCGIYFVYGILISLIVWKKIQECGIANVYPFIFVAIGILLALYGAKLISLEKQGKTCKGLEFIYAIAKYEFLIEQLVTRDFKIKYKRSILGVFWSFLNPLLMMIVQYVVFSNFFFRGGETEHYAIYLLAGIVMFNGFNDCTTQAMRAITSNATLITKVYVPKYIYPVTKVMSASLNLILSLVPLLLVTVVYGLFNGLYLKPSILLFPLMLVLYLIFIMGISFILSSLMVFFHDIEFLWGVLTTMWMYATPIIYPISMLEGATGVVGKIALTVININPLTHYVNFAREILINGCSPAMGEYLICFAWAALSLIVGIVIFHKTQDKFVLYI